MTAPILLGSGLFLYDQRVDPRMQALDDLRQMDEALEALLEALQAYQVTCAHTTSIISDGGPVSTAFDYARSVHARGSMSDALLAFERTRHRSRLSLIALSQMEGLSKTELAQLLGISRQLANRWVNESADRAKQPTTFDD